MLKNPFRTKFYWDKRKVRPRFLQGLGVDKADSRHHKIFEFGPWCLSERHLKHALFVEKLPSKPHITQDHDARHGGGGGRGNGASCSPTTTTKLPRVIHKHKLRDRFTQKSCNFLPNRTRRGKFGALTFTSSNMSVSPFTPVTGPTGQRSTYSTTGESSSSASLLRFILFFTKRGKSCERLSCFPRYQNKKHLQCIDVNLKMRNSRPHMSE